MDRDFYSFARLSDVKLPLTVRIASLQGRALPARDVFVTAQLFADNKALTLPYQTAYKSFKNPSNGHQRHNTGSSGAGSGSARLGKGKGENGVDEEGPSAAALASAADEIGKTLSPEGTGEGGLGASMTTTVHSRDFGETLSFPIRLCDLPLSSQLVFTAWDAASVEEVQRAFTNGDAEHRSSSTDPNASLRSFAKVLGGTTMKLFGKKGTLKKASHRLYLWPGIEGDGSLETATPSKVANDPSRKRDEMARLEKLIKQHESSELPHLPWLDKLAFRQIEKVHLEESMHSDNIYLYVDLPRFDMPIVYCEQEATSSMPSGATITQQQGQPPLAPLSVVDGQGLASSAARGIDASLFTVYDGDMLMERENPVEAKHRRLVRSHRSGPLDRELKPNAGVRDELNEILSYPPTRTLTSAESDLLWSFRFYLTRFPSGLTKFLKSVSWYDQSEAKQATETIMPMWSEIGMDDALELLGPGFKDHRVRAYAVRKLERADDEELMLYLLQLVQALKFELGVNRPGVDRTGPDGDNTSTRAATMSTAPANAAIESGLADFLMRRSCNNAILGNDFYWYLQVECDDRRYGKMFRRIRNAYLDRLQRTTKGAERRDIFRRQTDLVTLLSTRAKELRSTRDARPKKIERLRAMIADPKGGLHQFDPPLPLPLDANVEVSGIRADKSTVFKSNLFPMLLQFERASLGVQVSAPTDDADDSATGAAKLAASSTADDYAVIFKNGDDLRQDQLVIQLFTLMDRLLRNENLDLCITPYRVLATGAVDGMVQYVESMTLASILSQYNNSLLNYLRLHHADQSDEAIYGVKASVFETYLRSCAGYSVITYLLGVGDRHLDNLLLTPDGHFFHVDFGYILNRDPKPFPPAVKVSREMVEAMGGTTSPHYNKFKKYCFTAFTTLRKSANLILNLINLMVDANVTDIRFEPDKAVLKVQEKFKLDLSDEEAIRAFDDMLNETSYITVMLDRLHDAAQFFRS